VHHAGFCKYAVEEELLEHSPAALVRRPRVGYESQAVAWTVTNSVLRMPRAMVSQDVVLAVLEHHPLTATAAVVWSGDPPRPLQQVLFDAADGITPSAPTQTREHGPAPRSPDPLRRARRQHVPRACNTKYICSPDQAYAMCAHQPPCPPADHRDRDAARTVACHPE
jgi:hypothetical protein